MSANINPHRCEKSCYSGLDQSLEKGFVTGSEILPHTFEIAEKHNNVNVEVMRCEDCGYIHVEWSKPGKVIPIIERLD